MTNTIGELEVNGRFVGSKEYFIYLNKKFLKGELTKGSNYYKYGELYSDVLGKVKNGRYKGPLNVGKKTYKDDFYNIFKPLAKQIKDDLDKGKYWLNYIKDENAERLKKALSDLKACGVVEGFMATAQHKLEALNWYMDLDKAKVRLLQKYLNALGYGPLEENGIYDKKTYEAWLRFVDDLGRTKEYAALQKIGVNDENLIIAGGTVDLALYSGEKLVASQILIEAGLPFSKDNIKKLMEGTMRYKAIYAGHCLVIVFGIVLDLLELGIEIEKDLTDVDKKLGEKTKEKIIEVVLDLLGLIAGIAAGNYVFYLCAPLGPIGIMVGAVANYVICFAVTDASSKAGKAGVNFILDLLEI